MSLVWDCVAAQQPCDPPTVLCQRLIGADAITVLEAAQRSVGGPAPWASLVVKYGPRLEDAVTRRHVKALRSGLPMSPPGAAPADEPEPHTTEWLWKYAVGRRLAVGDSRDLLNLRGSDAEDIGSQDAIARLNDAVVVADPTRAARDAYARLSKCDVPRASRAAFTPACQPLPEDDASDDLMTRGVERHDERSTVPYTNDLHEALSIFDDASERSVDLLADSGSDTSGGGAPAADRAGGAVPRPRPTSPTFLPAHQTRVSARDGGVSAAAEAAAEAAVAAAVALKAATRTTAPGDDAGCDAMAVGHRVRQARDGEAARRAVLSRAHRATAGDAARRTAPNTNAIPRATDITTTTDTRTTTNRATTARAPRTSPPPTPTPTPAEAPPPPPARRHPPCVPTSTPSPQLIIPSTPRPTRLRPSGPLCSAPHVTQQVILRPYRGTTRETRLGRRTGGHRRRRRTSVATERATRQTLLTDA